MLQHTFETIFLHFIATSSWQQTIEAISWGSKRIENGFQFLPPSYKATWLGHVFLLLSCSFPQKKGKKHFLGGENRALSIDELYGSLSPSCIALGLIMPCTYYVLCCCYWLSRQVQPSILCHCWPTSISVFTICRSFQRRW